METQTLEVDILVIGGGTAGPMAAIKAKQKNPQLKVMLLEKANVKRSGAISMGMDGLNNAVIPGLRHPGTICPGNHRRQRWHRQSEHVVCLCQKQLCDDRRTG